MPLLTNSCGEPFYGDPRLQKLKDLLNDGAAKLYYTGVAINLLNLRPEICLLLYIKDRDWYSYHARNADPQLRFQFNDEWMGVVQMSAPETAVARIRYCRDDGVFLRSARVQPEELVPPGAAALWLGKWMCDELVYGLAPRADTNG